MLDNDKIKFQYMNTDFGCIALQVIENRLGWDVWSQAIVCWPNNYNYTTIIHGVIYWQLFIQWLHCKCIYSNFMSTTQIFMKFPAIYGTGIVLKLHDFFCEI